MPKLLNKEVGPIGYGLASLTTPPEFPPEDQALECLRTAADLGCLVWNAGEFYGTPKYNSLVLLNKLYTKYPEYADKVILSVKGAMLPTFSPTGDPEFVKKSVDNCLAQLGGKGRISMYETARIDTDIPLETQLNTLQDMVKEGKVESISLTEVSADTIRKAAKVVEIAAVEIELSVWCTDPLHNGILSTCAELEIPVMAGVLTSKIVSFEDIPAGDYRRMFPRYQSGNLALNRKLVEDIEKLAVKKGCTTAQVSLGWLLALSNREGMPSIIPIPGSGSIEHTRENAGTAPLTEDEMEVLESIILKHPIAGDRYHPRGMKHTNV